MIWSLSIKITTVLTIIRVTPIALITPNCIPRSQHSDDILSYYRISAYGMIGWVSSICYLQSDEFARYYFRKISNCSDIGVSGLLLTFFPAFYFPIRIAGGYLDAWCGHDEAGLAVADGHRVNGILPHSENLISITKLRNGTSEKSICRHPPRSKLWDPIRDGEYVWLLAGSNRGNLDIATVLCPLAVRKLN